jgi:hypothetical protein
MTSEAKRHKEEREEEEEGREREQQTFQLAFIS